jgi:hypothetical protein
MSETDVKERGEDLAECLAYVAHTACFESHWGIWRLPGCRVAIYNNHPDPRRDGLLEKLGAWLAAERLPEVGFATYPPEGEEGEGYTFVLIVLIDRIEADDAIAAEYQRLIHEAMGVAGPDDAPPRPERHLRLVK